MSPEGGSTWTLPGGRVEHGEDPFDAVVREVAEETGCAAVVERLLGVDSRVIPAATARAGVEHQNVGIFYQVRITGGEPRSEPDGEVAESFWTAFAEVAGLRRSSPVDVGLALAQTLPATGHVAPVPVGGLIQHCAPSASAGAGRAGPGCTPGCEKATERPRLDGGDQPGP